MKVYHIAVYLTLAAVLTGCVREENPEPSASGAVELQEIAAQIQNGALTRAGSVTALADYVGRSDFRGGDRVVFTEIRRTQTPIEYFTYPGSSNYEGIVFDALPEGGWVRDVGAGEPERIYWTDAQSDHTFMAYGCPHVVGFDWKRIKITEGDVQGTFYIGSLGDPTQTGTNDIIDYTLTAQEQETNHKTINNQEVYLNPKLENEDLVIACDEHMQAEPGGSVALVKFYHALSSIRVVVNISGFSSSSSAEDNKAVVSDMKLLHQPTMYIWMQADAGTHPVTSQAFVDKAWEGAASIPSCSQRKDIKLWIPHPEGTGQNQSKIFTFYGITTPQPLTYISTLGETDPGRKVEFAFKVTYPDPMNPTQMVTRDYTASMDEVYFWAGYNTTIHISLNHRNEKMTVGAEYENWQYVATPDVSELMKNSTFLQDTEKVNEKRTITIADDEEEATKDDATWLYKMGSSLYDIYGHTGDSEADAYQISTAYQLLSFAYEVKGGRTFEGKYIRLDADITLQPSSEAESGSLINWIGIGDTSHAFQGTFLGGNRFIYRLKGTPLFVNVGEQAHIQELHVSSQTMSDQNQYAVAGHGLIAETNAGTLSACIAAGDVTLSATEAGAYGALVGTNTGTLYASYHIGETKCADTATAGGLVGTNSGTVAYSFQAGNVTGSVTGGVVGANTGTLTNNFYNRTLLNPTYQPESGVKGKVTAEMTLPAFVMALNAGIRDWSYVFRPANYPVLGTYSAADGWLETDFDQLVTGDVFVFVGNNGSDYAMANNNGPEQSPSAVAVTIKNGAVAGTVPSNLQWTLTKSGDDYTFSPFGDNTVALYAMGESSNWINVREPGTDSKHIFVMDNGYLKCVSAGDRYLGIYNSTEWRAYKSHTNKNDNIYGQVFKFYKWYDNDGHNANVTLAHQGKVAYGTASTNLNLSNPHGLSVTLVSSDPTVATVDAGAVTATSAVIPVSILKAGTTSITASWSQTTVGDVTYPAGSYQYVLKVWPATATISFVNPQTWLTVGHSVTNTATVSTGVTSVTYSSNNEAVATVNPATGEVTGVATGMATITATVSDGNYTAVSAQYTMSVINNMAITLAQPAVGSFTAQCGSIDVSSGDEFAVGDVVTLTAVPASGYALRSWRVFRTDDPSVMVDVDNNNQFSMPPYGVTVTATFVQSASTLYYVKVTSAEELTDGDYLIVHEGSGNVLTGVSGSNIGTYASVTITNNQIAYNAASAYNIAIGKNGSNQYRMKQAGKYLAYTSTSTSGNNYLYAVEDPYTNGTLWTLSVDDARNVYNNSRYLRWNNNSNSYRFCCYTSGQSKISFYKLQTP